MKTSILIVVVSLLFSSCKSNSQAADTANFKSEKVSKTASITLNGTVDTVFPLFGAFDERKWTKGWNPVLVYPSTEIIEEGTTFKTPGHGHDENGFLWLVSKFEKEMHLIQYLVSTPNRYWTITIKCDPTNDNQTRAAITYSFIGLNEAGNKINVHAIEQMYKEDLKDWEAEINYYLANGSIKPH